MSNEPVDVFAWSDTAVGVTATTWKELSPRRNVVLFFVPVADSFASVKLASATFAVVIALSAISAVETPPSPSPLAVILSIAIVLYPLM
jgi:hypothetical protein